MQEKQNLQRLGVTLASQSRRPVNTETRVERDAISRQMEAMLINVYLRGVFNMAACLPFFRLCQRRLMKVHAGHITEKVREWQTISLFAKSA